MTIQQFDKVWKPWVTAATTEIVQRFPGTQNQGTYPGHDPNESLAVDFMVPIVEDGIGQHIAHFVADEAVCRRLGIWYVIWWGRIWSMTRPEQGWLHYFDADNPNPSRSHHNHVHVSFYNRTPIVNRDKEPRTDTPAGKTYTLILTRTTQGYTIVDGVGVSRGEAYLRQPGRKLTGRVGRRSDGRYLVTAYGTWYPLDNHNFTHLDGTPVGRT
ncbi:MAG: hypothetical protein ACR2LI_03340 [Propionibacteriaceae bacterium]